MAYRAIPTGWRFDTSDFSMQAAEGYCHSVCVVLVRDPEQKARWHKLPDSVKDSDDCPPLFVKGWGVDLEQAIADACYRASQQQIL